MSNGCICCTLRDDLLKEVSRLAGENRFDYLLIESTGISEPLPVAQTFTFSDEDGISLQSLTRLDTMVTVVDAASFLAQFREAETLREHGVALGTEDERTIADLLIDQVEFADVIVINKSDLVSLGQRRELHAVLRRLNPVAVVIEAERGQVPLDEILDTGHFDMEKAQRSAGWLRELNNIHTPETEGYGISSFTFHARRPFHPKRFWDFIHHDWPGLLRSKGHFWLATRNDMIGAWSQAGGSAEYRPIGFWWAAAAKEKWPDDGEIRDYINREWQEPHGDRRQELVFIGQDLPKDEMLLALRKCLLDDREMAFGPQGWNAVFRDPFPSWAIQPAEQAHANRLKPFEALQMKGD